MVRFGFTLAADGRSLVADDIEQAAIALMASLRNDGVTYREIAAELTRRGIAPKESTAWEHSTIRRILGRAA